MSTPDDLETLLRRHDEAIKELKRRKSIVPSRNPQMDSLEVLGDVARARAEMLKVLELDARDAEDHEPVSEELAEDLRGQFESLLEDIPERVLGLVATAPITVQARPTVAQVQAGADPRGLVVFTGQMRTDDADARLDGIVLMRDFLLDEIEGDDDIPELLMVGLVDELRRHFN